MIPFHHTPYLIPSLPQSNTPIPNRWIPGLSFGMLQLPTLGLAAPYATAADPTGFASPEYNSVIALYLLVWGFALFTFFIFTCKINSVFAAIFLLVSTASWVLSGAYWKVSQGQFEEAGRLQKVRFSDTHLVSLLQFWFPPRCCVRWVSDSMCQGQD